MNSEFIPRHQMENGSFFSIDKIENADEIFFKEIHRHNFFELLWFTQVSKSDFHWIDFEKYSLKNNQIFILTPHQVHQMDIGKKKGYILTFSEDFFKSLVDFPTKLLFKPFFFEQHIDNSVSEILEKIITLVEDEYNNDGRRNILQAYCTAFILHFSLLYDSKFISNNDRISKLLELIDSNYKNHKEVDFYANELALSVRQLNEICVTSTGKPVKQLILDRLIVEAKRLIAIPYLSISQIAYELNFKEPAYFTRIFKHKAGISPIEFRNTLNS